VIKNADRLNLRSPGAAPALRELIRDLAELGKASEGIEYARSAATANPRNPESQTILGEALWLAGEPEEADSAFVRALALDATHRRGLLGRARLATVSNQASQALAFYDQILEVDAEILRGRAEALVLLGREEEAEAELTRALGQSPYDADAAGQLVELKRALGADDSEISFLVQRAARFGRSVSAGALREEREAD